jgi:hypothetical protein
MLIPEQWCDPGFGVVYERFDASSEVHLRSSLSSIHDAVMPRLLTMTFTTTVFDRSSSWQFEASSYKAAPKGPPSSLVQHGTFAPS